MPAAPSATLPPLDVGATFAGKNLLLIGCTGFVGKVALSQLLYHYPGIHKVFTLVRPGMGATPEDRFFKKVATSPVFDPLRERWGDGYLSFLQEKVVPVAGDVGRALCNFGDADFERFAAAGGLHAIINSAGLVSFTPPLESAIRINVLGAQHCVDVARKTGAGLVHVSTCFVAGRRDGQVWEDEPVIGYFPRRDELSDDDFDAAAELADCQRAIEEVKTRANDRVHTSEFREKAARALRQQVRDPDDVAVMKLAVARERKLWVYAEQTRIGMERAAHWGWTNTYTYTKSLGEQIVLAAGDVPVTVVRPAIVESSLKFPFPGWNEGFNTTAPLVYLVMKGHRQIIAAKHALDVIPVDHVSAGMIMATAAVIAGRHEPVYQFGSSDSNPVSPARLVELTALAVRRLKRAKADAGERPIENRVRARLESLPVSDRQFRLASAPQLRRLSTWATRTIDEHTPRWGAPRLQAIAERVKDELDKVTDFTGRVIDLMELFKPFTYDCDLEFRCDNVRALHASLTPHDQRAIPWEPEAVHWRTYWMDTHFPGLQRWVFPVLDDEFGVKPRSIYTHRDLLELFDAATKLNRHRVAMRYLPSRADDEPVVYTYERVQDMAQQVGAGLRERGVAPDDRVMLMAENRPEWGIAYFGVLKAGGVVVPLDEKLSLPEVANLAGASGAAALILTPRVAARLAEDAGAGIDPDGGRSSRRVDSAGDAGGDAPDPFAFVAAELAKAGAAARVLEIDDLLVEPSVSPGALVPARKPEQTASIIFTSGTTGTPKGVVLSHKNFTAMVSKLASLFRLYRHDALLSVLPLHHTLEFSAGLLMPLLSGAQITYLEEVGAEGLARAMDEGHVTGMVGVPALWQALQRKMEKPFAEHGTLVLRAFETVVDLNRRLRDRTPYGMHVGKLLFQPIHRRLGGRLRLLISGGSALPVDTMKAFRGLGFKLFEGYGMTEAAPVIAVQRPGETPRPGSVGPALPGVDLKIHDPDERGVGEVIARGPSVMVGYYQNEAATESVLRGGWLHTGDLGRLDEDGNLYIVGRKKEMILGASGENVYPDELEEAYKGSPFVKEISVVGLPGAAGETVAALVVPDYDAEGGLGREEIRERVRDHLKQTSQRLPLYKRIKLFHLWDHDLPKTATRKVKRREVVAELEKLEAVARAAQRTVAGAGKGEAPPSPPASTGDDAGWVREVLAGVSQRPLAEVVPDARLADLGFDSLMFTELGVALEAAGVALPDPAELNGLETVADVEALARRHRGKPRGERRPEKRRTENGARDEIHVPAPLVRAGRKTLRLGQRAIYERLLDTRVRGTAYVPPTGGYIVAANHSSHLDMGLVKHALGEQGDRLVALAAKDYFFEDPVRRMYFENFTNLVPMERHGSLRESLRLAGEVIREGYILLIFPEGTRSETGVMIDFKPSLGYLALANRCGILPMYLAGTHGAMPKGAFLPRRGREVEAGFGPFQSHAALVALAAGASKAEGYRRIATHVEGIVRRLAPPAYEWTLGAAGRAPAAGGTPARGLGLRPPRVPPREGEERP